MAKTKREKIKLKSSESDTFFYTVKNKTNSTERLRLKKFDKKLNKRVEFVETK